MSTLSSYRVARYKKVPCNRFDVRTGKRIGYCQWGSECRYIHPTDPEWQRITSSKEADQDTKGPTSSSTTWNRTRDPMTHSSAGSLTSSSIYPGRDDQHGSITSLIPSRIHSSDVPQNDLGEILRNPPERKRCFGQASLESDSAGDSRKPSRKGRPRANGKVRPSMRTSLMQILKTKLDVRNETLFASLERITALGVDSQNKSRRRRDYRRLMSIIENLPAGAALAIHPSLDALCRCAEEEDRAIKEIASQREQCWNEVLNLAASDTLGTLDALRSWSNAGHSLQHGGTSGLPRHVHSSPLAVSKEHRSRYSPSREDAMSCKTVTGSVVDGISSMRVSGAREKMDTHHS